MPPQFNPLVPYIILIFYCHGTSYRNTFYDYFISVVSKVKD